jgi:hypothetical protein
MLSLCPNGVPVAAMARTYSFRQLYLSLRQYKINVNSTVVERNAANMSNRTGVLLADRVFAELEMTNGSKAPRYTE